MFTKVAFTRLEGLIKSQLLRITSSPLLGYIIPFLPYRPDRNAYIVEKTEKNYTKTQKTQSGLTLPIPPTKLWLGYGPTQEDYLERGKRHTSQMLSILESDGLRIGEDNRILDFGCGAGRMIRWLSHLSDNCEIWGTDISAEHIYWCREYLSPPFHFVTSTIYPHLPFEDNYFDLVYAGSVFSHIDDLADAWLLELRRITKKRVFVYYYNG